MKITKKGDFLLLNSKNRCNLDGMYRGMKMIGYTLNKNDLLQMATSIKWNRDGMGANEITSVNEAVSVIEGGGWVVLEFLN